MDVRVIVSRLEIKLGCQKMEMLLISQVDYALKRKFRSLSFFISRRIVSPTNRGRQE